MFKRIAGGLVTAAALFGIGFAVNIPANASTAVTATTQVSAHPDTTSVSGPACGTSSNGPVWALDAYASEMSAVQAAPGTWSVVLTDVGTYKAIADPTTCNAIYSTGSFNGQYDVTVTSPVAPSASFLHKSYKGAVSTSQMIADFFDDPASGFSIVGGPYSFQYQSGNYVQTSDGTSYAAFGDITATPAVNVILQYVCGVSGDSKWQWTVQNQSASPSATLKLYSFPTSSPVFDGTYTESGSGTYTDHRRGDLGISWSPSSESGSTWIHAHIPLLKNAC